MKIAEFAYLQSPFFLFSSFFLSLKLISFPVLILILYCSASIFLSKQISFFFPLVFSSNSSLYNFPLKFFFPLLFFFLWRLLFILPNIHSFISYSLLSHHLLKLSTPFSSYYLILLFSFIYFSILSFIP